MIARPVPDLPDLLHIELKAHRDARGTFTERWRADVMADMGLPTFVQLNHSRSLRGALRGLHFQAPPMAQGKLVSVLHGEVFDVAVDLRPGSAGYGRWAGVALGGERAEALWVPPGFAHGFLVLSDVADVIYQVDAGHAPGLEGGLRWDDPAIGIRWPLAAGEAPLVSEKDDSWPSFEDFRSPFA